MPGLTSDRNRRAARDTSTARLVRREACSGHFAEMPREISVAQRRPAGGWCAAGRCRLRFAERSRRGRRGQRRTRNRRTEARAPARDAGQLIAGRTVEPRVLPLPHPSVAAADFMLGSGSEVARRSGRVICLSVSLPRGNGRGPRGGWVEACRAVRLATSLMPLRTHACLDHTQNLNFF